MEQVINFDTYETVALASLVLLLGYFLVKRIYILRHYNIPEPVVGGFIIAVILFFTHKFAKLSFTFDMQLSRTMMLVFFTSIGLSANFKRLIKGGRPLAIFLIGAAILIVLQDTIGVLGAVISGLDPAYGIIAGSVTLTGGHGTGAAWAADLSAKYNIVGVAELAMACATFGLVSGGIIGGPVASYLLNKRHQQEIVEDENKDEVEETFEKPVYKRRVNVRSIVEIIAMMSFCLFVGQKLDNATKGTAMQLPTFVWCLFTGTLVRNFLTLGFKFNFPDETNDVLGTVGLSIFLAIALMSLKLWELAGLALPIFVILLVQVALMMFFAIFITYRIMGKDYDAVVLSAGHCGFGLGATPTAVANMQAVTSHYGMSHKAFLIVPIVGAFFIDILNATILKMFLFIIDALH